jgi:hypothetical protein
MLDKRKQIHKRLLMAEIVALLLLLFVQLLLSLFVIASSNKGM